MGLFIQLGVFVRFVRGYCCFRMVRGDELQLFLKLIHAIKALHKQALAKHERLFILGGLLDGPLVGQLLHNLVGLRDGPLAGQLLHILVGLLDGLLVRQLLHTLVRQSSLKHQQLLSLHGWVPINLNPNSINFQTLLHKPLVLLALKPLSIPLFSSVLL